ncbi:ABC transporter permease [Mobilitalea sibirica]|uniref:ABC transporter permease n=1 Tax=Mobilitalea sibirica TaxID=1462919 RepID=A0A8J7KXI8_9FIRM|nr:ABC transporter permease [Mobilitalea sibirica]MBH1941832.1 ABC transporter permease [Mobilitalea sibirica]
MRNLKKLVLGELHRLINYKILPISLVTAIIWIIIFLFLSEEEARNIAPLLIFVDVSMMSIILIGASHHFEKQEGTIKSMMMMPVSMGDILLAKVLSSMVLGLESAIVTSAALYFIHGVTFNYMVLLIFIIIAGVAHAAIAFILALNSKDFTSSLGLLMAYILPFQLPSMLFTFGIIEKEYEWLLMFSPSHAASSLITFAVSSDYDALKVLIGCLYLVFLSIVLFRYFVYSKFKSNAVRG